MRSTFSNCGRTFSAAAAERVRAGLLATYRWQYIISGVQEPRFSEILSSMITGSQADRIGKTLALVIN